MTHYRRSAEWSLCGLRGVATTADPAAVGCANCQRRRTFPAPPPKPWKARALAAEAERDRLRAAVRAALTPQHEAGAPGSPALMWLAGAHAVQQGIRDALTPEDLATLEGR